MKSVSISGYLAAKPLCILSAVWLVGFLAPNFLVCLLEPATMGMTISGGLPVSLGVAMVCSMAQTIGIICSIVLAYGISFFIVSGGRSPDCNFDDFSHAFWSIVLGCIFSIVSMVAADFYVFKFFQSLHIVSGTQNQLLLAGGIATSLVLVTIAVSLGSWSHVQRAAIVSGRQKEATAVISEAKKQGIETCSYEAILRSKENKLDRLNLVIDRLRERVRLAASISEAKEQGIETAPYEAALVAIERNILEESLVPLLNVLFKRKFVAEKLSAAKKRGIDTASLEEPLAGIEHSIECHQNLIVANDQLASSITSIEKSCSVPRSDKGFISSYELIDGGALIKIERTSEASKNSVKALASLTYRVNLPSYCRTSPGSHRASIATLLVYDQTVKMLDIHIYCPPSTIFGLRTEQAIDDWVHKWSDAMSQCDSSFTVLPSVEQISLGSLAAYKINWTTTRGRAFAILGKDGPCVVEMSSLLTNHKNYDSNLIPAAEEIALSFRKQ